MADTAEIVIRTTGLSKTFADGFEAVTELDLEIRQGEVFGFLGPNGAGKTTSIRMMTGLLHPTSGETEIAGERVEPGSEVIRQRVGVVPQQIVVWQKLTCWENLMFMARLYNVPKIEAVQRANKLLEDLQLSEKKKVRASKLSGGMQRRLNLALALMHDPDILVLDEPTPGLDPQTRLVVWDFIRGVARGAKTVILTTHFMEEADRLSDRVAIIDHGKLLVVETPQALKDSIGEGDNIDLQIEGDPEAVAQKLGTLDGVFEARVIGEKIQVRVLDGVQKLQAIFETVEEMGDQVIDVNVRRTTLEDVFIHLTGREMREG